MEEYARRGCEEHIRRGVFWRIAFCGILHCRVWERSSCSCQVCWIILLENEEMSGCFVRCKNRNKTHGCSWALRRWWVFLSSKKMLLVVFLHEETRFVYMWLLSEILLHQWLQSHNPGTLFEVFFKLVAKRSNFRRIIFDVLWAWRYLRKVKPVENSLHVACCVAFSCFFLDEFGEFFCVNRTEILVRCAGFVRKVFFQ